MIQKRRVALEAVIEQAIYIAQDSPAQAERFIDSVEKTLNKLESMPRIGRIYES